MQPSKLGLVGGDAESPGRDNETLKVVLVGPYRSGKTSLIRALAEDAISVERLGSSVSLDFGRTRVGHQEIDIFGTPGRKEFAFLRCVVGQGSHVCLLVVDATDGEKLEEVREQYARLRSRSLPVVIVANKQDLEGAMRPDLLRRLLDADDVPVVGTSAHTGEGLDTLLDTIVNVAKGEGT